MTTRVPVPFPLPPPYPHSWSGQAYSSGAPFTVGWGNTGAGSPYPVRGSFMLDGFIKAPLLAGTHAVASIVGTFNGDVFYIACYVDSIDNLVLATRFPTNHGSWHTATATMSIASGGGFGPMTPGDWYYWTIGSWFSDRQGAGPTNFALGALGQSVNVSVGGSGVANPLLAAFYTPSTVPGTTFGVDVAFGHDLSGLLPVVDWPDDAGHIMAKGRMQYQQQGPYIIGSPVVSYALANITPLASPWQPPTADTVPSADFLGLWLVNQGERASGATQLADDNSGFSSVALPAGASLTLRTPSPY